MLPQSSMVSEHYNSVKPNKPIGQTQSCMVMHYAGLRNAIIIIIPAVRYTLVTVCTVHIYIYINICGIRCCLKSWYTLYQVHYSNSYRVYSHSTILHLSPNNLSDIYALKNLNRPKRAEIPDLLVDMDLAYFSNQKSLSLKNCRKFSNWLGYFDESKIFLTKRMLLFIVF